MENNINEILNDLFLTTGEIGYKLLDEAIANLELDKEAEEEQELEA